tara:strand:+ start:25 stop:270 length:246 start_codon:yes stop_codon:yes gene_type:complete
MSKNKLKKVASELEKASKMHANQAKKIKSMLNKPGPFKMKSPLYKKKGLWDNIHAKRRRGESPNKPGDKGYPTDKAIRDSQ